MKKSITFLGIMLELGTSCKDAVLKSATRNGAMLEFKDSASLLIFLERE